jgi:hypothetical protein
MHRAVPPEQWPGTECRLKRAFNLRLARSEEIADAWVLRETKAYDDHAIQRQKSELLASITKAATAILTVAAYLAGKTLWRD